MNRQTNDTETAEIQHIVSQSEFIEPLDLFTVSDIIWAASEFKYFIDIQRKGKIKSISADGSLVDVRDTYGYSKATKVLDFFQLRSDSENGIICPAHVLFNAMPICNFNSESCPIMGFDASSIFKHVGHDPTDEEFEVLNLVCNRLKGNFPLCFVANGVSFDK